jgi:hypothetical protein
MCFSFLDAGRSKGPEARRIPRTIGRAFVRCAPSVATAIRADFNTDYDRPIPPSLFEGLLSLPLIDYAAHFRAIQ